MSSSLLEGAVRTEDCYTNLLRNLMLEEPEFGRAVFQRLLPNDLQSFAHESFLVTTQVPLGYGGVDHGRADMFIETDSIKLLVEVKINIWCNLTENQGTNCLNRNRGYIPYLLGQDKEKHVGITYLVPQKWKYWTAIEADLALVGKRLPIALIPWQRLQKVTGQYPQNLLIQEFSKLLERDFMTIALDADEKNLLKQANPAFSSLSKKMREIVKRSQGDLLSVLNIGDGTEFTATWSQDDSEYGFQLLFQRKPILWFGIWDDSRFPIVAAIKDDWAAATLAITLFGQGERERVAPGRSPKWRLYDLTDAVLISDGDPQEAIVKQLANMAKAIQSKMEGNSTTS